MGTPEFAVPSLQALVEHGYEVVGVVTATDKWGGRGNKELIESAVKKYAVSQNLRILQPDKLKNPEFVQTLKDLRADIQVVVAFRMLPEIVWNMPPLGTLNLHGSLLPKYRGAAPIHWAVMNGDTETGLSTFRLKHEIDTGDIIQQVKTPIGAEETTGEVHDRLMPMGAELVLQTIRSIEAGKYEPIPQDEGLVCPAPKLFLENTRLQPESQTCQQMYNWVRGLNPYPTAWYKWGEEFVKIHKAKAEICMHDTPVGTIVCYPKQQFLALAAKDGWLHLEELQLEKRRKMTKKDFLNGYKA